MKYRITIEFDDVKPAVNVPVEPRKARRDPIPAHDPTCDGGSLKEFFGPFDQWQRDYKQRRNLLEFNPFEGSDL